MAGSLGIQDVIVDRDVVGDDVIVRVLTLDHAARRNALSPAMLTALQQALPRRSAGPQQPVRAVVLQGAAGTFSSGFDRTALDDDERARGVDPITPTATALQGCPVPVVAAIDGFCMGGAVELAAACAIRVAAMTATFAVPAVGLGLVYPTNGLARLRTVLGRHAERVLVVGESFSAAQARDWGLVDDVVDDPRAHASALARRIAVNAPLAVSGTLAALQALDAGAIEDAERARHPALSSLDLLEGLDAATKKRPPKFGGR
jgi:enoyl-CoA hydratase/carnithine racemase